MREIPDVNKEDILSLLPATCNCACRNPLYEIADQGRKCFACIPSYDLPVVGFQQRPQLMKLLPAQGWHSKS